MKKYGKMLTFLLMATIILGVLISTTACARHHTVQFDTGANSPRVANQRVRAGTHAARPKINPVKDGHEFVNWYTDKHGGDVFNFENPVNKNKTAYARWNNANSNYNQHNAFNNHDSKNYLQNYRHNFHNRFNNKNCFDNNCFDIDANNINRFDDCYTNDCLLARRQDRMTRRNNQVIGQDSRTIDNFGVNSNRGYDQVSQPDSAQGNLNPNIRTPNPYPAPLPTRAPAVVR
ncbi:MAG: InlB B-repeat-containing protein [Firmicutes bacterium]|nr:InlB B-repeat-containing protein [Bacillota bacterium]